MIKTLNDVRLAYKLSAPKTVKTKCDLTYAKIPETACTIPAGTELQVHFSETFSSKLFFEFNGALQSDYVVDAHKKFTGFSKCPSLRSIEKTENERGGCKTPTGYFVEPDGHGPDGSPSWGLVAGLI